MTQPRLNTFARVRELGDWKAVAFGAALLERMLPNYTLFCDATGYEDDGVHRKCLDLVWEWLRTPRSKINFAVHLEKVEDATPDTQDYDFYGVYPAIDAAMAMSALINLVLAQDEQGAVVISKLSQGSVEAFLLLSDEATDDNVKDHPLMQFEIETQQELLAQLDTMGRKPEALDAFRAMSLEAGMSNIGLEL